VIDGGDVCVTLSPWVDDGFPLKALEHVLDVARRQASLVARSVESGMAPLVVGGDCTTLLGTAAGLRQAGIRFGLICFDAHGDFNTHLTTPSGNIHGMTVTAVAGRGASALQAVFGDGPTVTEDRITLLGVRDLDPPEAEALVASNVLVLAPQDVRRLGAARCGMSALERATGKGNDPTGEPYGVLLHVDLDVLEPDAGLGVGLPVPGGLQLEELLEALRPIRDSGRVVAAELTESAISLDPDGRTPSIVEDLLGLLSHTLARRADELR